MVGVSGTGDDSSGPVATIYIHRPYGRLHEGGLWPYDTFIRAEAMGQWQLLT